MTEIRHNPYLVAEILWYTFTVNDTSILHCGNTVLKSLSPLLNISYKWSDSCCKVQRQRNEKEKGKEFFFGLNKLAT
jgi:hypothetical protein